MHHRTTACFLILLLLCCGLQCNTDVARVVLPEVTAPAEDNVTEPPLFEMEAILATRGEVHSPIPDDVYDLLWGHWTKAGLSTPRDYYTKYIDADGIAIVGGDLVTDRHFQKARHIALVMTSKVPGIRDALSYNQLGGVSGDEVPFRFVLIADYLDVQHLPENLNVNVSGTIHWGGSCGTFMCRANIDGGATTIIHEMTHAINYAILERNLVPNFGERLEAAFAKEMDKVRLRTEIDGEPYLPYLNADGEIVTIWDLPEWGDRPNYCMANSNSHDNAWEFWAWFVERKWFDDMFDPRYLSLPGTSLTSWFRSDCPNLFFVTEEVFPAFPLHWAINAKDYTK